MPIEPATVSRRDLLSLIGAVSGSAAMYHAMTSMGFAADSGYQGPIKLDGDPKGVSVLILGAGLAGMTAALELRKAGYNVQVLEYNSRAGRAHLDAARRRFRSRRTRRRRAGPAEFAARALYQSRPVAHSVSPPRRCSITASASASRFGTVHPGQPQCAFLHATRRVWRNTAALFATVQGGFSRRRLPICSPKP